ncbi:hypothetical protein [Ottowia sp.]
MTLPGDKRRAAQSRAGMETAMALMAEFLAIQLVALAVLGAAYWAATR